MSDVPEWFDRLKTEWPGEWAYDADLGEAVLSCGTICVSVWFLKGKFAASMYSTYFEHDICIGSGFGELRQKVAEAAEFYLAEFRKVAAAALVGGES